MAVEKKISDIELLDSISNDINLIAEQNGEWKRLNGNKLDNVFIVWVHITTYDKVKEAYESGKRLYCKVGTLNFNFIAPLVYVETKYDSNNNPYYYFEFACVYEGENHCYKLDSLNKWQYTNIQYQKWIEGIDAEVIKNTQKIQSLLTTVNDSKMLFQCASIPASDKVYTKNLGLTLYVGNDYNLNLTQNGNKIGNNDNNLIIALFSARDNASDKIIRIFYAKTYKKLGVVSLESGTMDIDKTVEGWENYYPCVTNTNSENNAMAFIASANESM